MSLVAILQKAARGKPGWLTAGNIRLFSGMVLMLFLFSHMLNHTLGLISLDAMEAGRQVFVAFWRSGFGTVLLLTSLTLHSVLGLMRLVLRHSYKGIRAKEALQIIMGVAIPPLILLHIIATRLLYETHGVEASYTFVLYAIWVDAPLLGLMQSATLLLAWFHGCLGLHFWLRLKPWYDKYFTLLYSLWIILPLLALAGFINGANTVEFLARDPLWRQALFNGLQLPDNIYPWAYDLRDNGYRLMIAIMIVLGLGRIGVEIAARRKKGIVISYPNEQSVTVPPGSTILEASHRGGIAHASVCGGKGRCSTCRVRIVDGQDNLNPPSDGELAVLKRVNAAAVTRLACQTEPLGPLSVIPLLPARAPTHEAFEKADYLQGSEKEIAILFADLRAFTKFSEQKLPYDVVFVINQYFRHMGVAIERSGGHLDKFIGDGVMALFGLDNDVRSGCRQALNAAHAMAEELNEMNRNLRHDLPEPLRIGIGIHVGQVIVGEMGYGHATSVTAIGDAVNTASRLEAMTKEFSSQLIFSDRVKRRAGIDLPGFKTEQVIVRGRKAPLDIHIVKNALDIPDQRIEG